MAINFTAWHDRNTANHKTEADNAFAKGFRTISLCVYGERGDPRYAAVMVKRPVVHDEDRFFGLSGSQFEQKIKEMSAKGFGAYIVTATGPANNPLIAASFRKMNQTPLTIFGINAEQLAQLNREAWRSGEIPASIDAYGTPGDVRYIAVWHPNTARVAWNLEAVSDAVDVAGEQARFNAIIGQGGRSVFVVMTPENKYLTLFVDDVIGKWESRGDLTSLKYEQKIKTQSDNGLAPVHIAAQGTGANTRFSVNFAEREEPVSRVFTVSTTTPSIAKIDNAIKKYMEDHSIRGCALAITQGTRLVYAKGYTSAEPGYTPVEPTTLFRLASVSKIFVAAAIYRLIEQGVFTSDGKKFTLETTMQSVLKLKTPDGKPPVSPQFKDIKIRHLLESTSGLRQRLIFRSVEAAAAFGKSLPCLPHQLASYCASQPLQTDENNKEKKPGDTTNIVYGNLDYFMLSQVVAQLCGTDTFEDALGQRVLEPLGIKRIRGSRSLLSAQAKDEARYDTINIHPVPKLNEKSEPTGEFEEDPLSLALGLSSLSDDRPLVPDQYGTWHYEIFDGCGGLSGAVTDIARLVAALSLRKNNPVFSEKTLNDWFENAAAAAKLFVKNKAHGAGHGFDSSSKNLNIIPPPPFNFTASKGGWIPSASCNVMFTTDGLGFVIVANSCGQKDVKTDWHSIFQIAFEHNWGATDLFPLEQFGMASFKFGIVSSLASKFDAAKILTFSKKLNESNNLERQAMTEQRAKLR